MAHSPEKPGNPPPDSRAKSPQCVPDWRNPFAPPDGFTTQIMPDHSVRFVPISGETVDSPNISQPDALH